MRAGAYGWDPVTQTRIITDCVCVSLTQTHTYMGVGTRWVPGICFSRDLDITLSVPPGGT